MGRRCLGLFCLFALVLLFSFSGNAEEPQQKWARESWGADVGFEPNLTVEGYEPGMTIDAGNFESFKEILPEPVRIMIEKYGMVLETRAYAPYAPSNGYIKATQKNIGKAKLLPIKNPTGDRELEGYAGGMPFPHPKNGREVAWNFVLAHGGDDSETEFAVYWIKQNKGVERYEIWRTTSIHRAKYRTDIPPFPEVPQLTKLGVIAATLTQALYPTDRKDYASLYYGYLEPREPNGWLYLPPQRRSIRLAFGLKGEAWNNTDLLYEDVRGFTGSPEWMDWKIVAQKTMLLPVHSGVTLGKGNEKQVFDFDNAPNWNPKVKWELRPVYVIESKPRLQDYPYSRMLLYMDAENGHAYAKSAYDRKGNLWKLLLIGTDKSDSPAAKPMKPAFSLVVDLQLEHGTAFFWHKVRSNFGAKPNLFMQSTLSRLGK